MNAVVVSEAVRARLRFVRARGDEDLSRFPDFLIIGPQRTGTTWLHAHLRFHPQIFLSEPKELYFFSSRQSAASRPIRSSGCRTVLNAGV
jgi:hypothetical protein